MIFAIIGKIKIKWYSAFVILGCVHVIGDANTNIARIPREDDDWEDAAPEMEVENSEDEGSDMDGPAMVVEIGDSTDVGSPILPKFYEGTESIDEVLASSDIYKHISESDVPHISDVPELEIEIGDSSENEDADWEDAAPEVAPEVAVAALEEVAEVFDEDADNNNDGDDDIYWM